MIRLTVGAEIFGGKMEFYDAANSRETPQPGPPSFRRSCSSSFQLRRKGGFDLPLPQALGPPDNFRPRCSGLQSGAMKIFGRLPLVLLLGGATASGFLINSLHAATQDEQAILAPITAMFDAMAKHDAVAMKKPLLPGGGMVLMRDGKPTQMTFDAFADLVGKPGKAQIQERIHDPLVRIDNDLAVVWAPFEFLVDGKVDHCGTDLFNLVRADGKWLIASVADTGRKDCSIK
ncbi:MAG: hypothetical protein JWM83_2253 [Candidatus Angelobacter sp.]|nr:hypothetical protein [Candidatus Angelobacter sp.]